MKLLVLGHSDTDGSHLPNRGDAWPYLVQREIAESRRVAVEVVHRMLFAGPTASQYVETQVQRVQPDVVVLCTSTYAVVMELISNRVREVFGERAARLASWGERNAARATQHGGFGARPIMGARALARRLIGTRATMEMDDLLASYRDCMAVLARAEQVHTLVLSGAGYTLEHERLNPRLGTVQDGTTVEFRTMAERHRFGFASHDALLGGRGRKERYYLPDGIHTGEESHRMVAAALMPLVLGGSIRPWL